jgi:mannose-1-phosphate guanylyltransferase
VYVFAPRALEYVGESGFQDIKESLIPRLHRAGERVVAHHSPGFCPHVFDARTYLAVNEWMVQSLALQGEDRLIDPTARVERGACLVGPVQIGAGARVQAGATVVGPATIGPESTVKRNALVARSVVWERAVMREGSVVHGCVVGQDVVIPPAARLFHVVCPQAQGLPGLNAGPGATPVTSDAPPRGALAGSLPTSCPIG